MRPFYQLAMRQVNPSITVPADWEDNLKALCNASFQDTLPSIL
jgi:hypothetical protein